LDLLQLVSCNSMSIASVKRQRHLVNAYEGKAGMVLFAGKTV